MELTDKSFLLIDNMEEIPKIFKSTWTYIKSFLEHLYKLPKFIANLISLSNKEDVKNNIAPFFVDNYFENILSLNSLDNNLIYIIYSLLKEEIDSLSDVNDINKFLDNTVCGYVLGQLIEKMDIQSYCRLNILEVVKDLEWTFSGKKMGFDIDNIAQSLSKKKESQNQGAENGQNKKVNIKRSYSIFSAHDEFNDSSSYISRINTVSSFDGFGEKEYIKQKKNLEDSKLFNSKYIVDIDPKKIDYSSYDKDMANNIKEFIDFQMKNSDNKWNLYSNESFIGNVFKGQKSEEVLSIYIVSFIKVVESVNLFFEKLSINQGIIPYSLKCICKIIYILLKKKFPDINRLQENAFMSRFLFDKILLPFLENPIYGALINEYMISPETVDNIKIVSQIISRICSGKLFNQKENNGNYTPFNKLLLEKMAHVYKFYENIEEVSLPDFLEEIIEKKIDDKSVKFIDEPIKHRETCFCIEELYSIFINISKNKDKLFKDEETKTLSKIFDKIDKKSNMKIIEDIMHEKIYENIDEDKTEHKKNDKKKDKKKDKKDTKNKEIKRYFLITDLILNEENSHVFKFNKEKPMFQIKEIKNSETKEDIDNNNIIKVKNIICTILYYLREINLVDFNFNSNHLTDTSKIFGEIRKLMKSSYFVLEESIPYEWYVNTLLQYIGKLPKKYIENDYELLYDELKNDVIKCIKSFDLAILSDIIDKLKYGKRKKFFYELAEKRLIDITLNEKVQQILNKFKIPCELYFCYNDKDKAMKIRELKKDDNTLKFLDSMVFVEQSKYIKTCNFIKDFTKYFPNIVKSSLFFGENEKIIKMIKDLEIPKIIIKYLGFVKNKLQALKIWKTEKEFKDVNDKIYDFVMEKIYDKMFPTFQSNNDITLYNLCIKLSWTEPKHYIIGKNNYIFDSFLPDVIYNFLKIEEEKSPRKKLIYMKNIFECIKQVQNFNGSDGSKAGVDDIINILQFAFVKAQLEMSETNIEYLKLFVKQNSEEDHFLTQLNVVNEFIMKINHEKLKVSKEEFDTNCEQSFNEFNNSC